MVGFAAWCVQLVVEVSDLRGRLSVRAGWTRALQDTQARVERAVVVGDVESLLVSSVAFAPTAESIVGAFDTTPAIRRLTAQLQQRLRELEASFETNEGRRGAATNAFSAAHALLNAVRRDNAELSRALGASFFAYNWLVAAALLLGSATLALSWIARRRGASLRSTAAALAAEVAERTRAEAAARESYRLETALFEHTPMSIGIFSPDGGLRRANAALQAMFDRFEGPETNGFDLRRDAWALASGAAGVFERAAAGAATGPVDIVIEGPRLDEAAEGGVILSAMCFPLRDDAGEVSEVVACLQDVGEQRRLALRLASLGRLTASVAHEINNPLFYATGALSFLRESLAAHWHRLPEPMAEEWRDALDDAGDGLARVSTIARDLQQLARPTRGRRRRVDVRRAVELALEVAANTVERTARIVRSFEPAPDVLADEGRLGQVFLNLLVNAGQACAEASARNHVVEVATGTDAAGWAIVEVRDTGVGMAPDVVPRLFDPFYTTKSGEDGMGLGLALSRDIVRGYGGHIEVESVIGAGSRFRVRLPAVPRVHVDRASIERGPPPDRRLRVLSLDDDPAVGVAIKRILGGRHDVVTVTTVAAARARIEADLPYDCVICDLHLGRDTGIAFYEWLAARDTALAERVVFLTAGPASNEAADFVAQHADRCLFKPIDANALAGWLVDRGVT